MNKPDILTVEILEDGTIKTTTDAVSGANHANAEAFMRELSRMTDAKLSREKRTPHMHQHVGQHHHH